MSKWFDEQLRSRIRQDQERFDRAFADLSSVIMGERFRQSFADQRCLTQNATDEVLRYFHLELTAVPETVTDLEEFLNYALRPAGVMRRRVLLKTGWYKDAMGPMLCTLKTGQTVALLPRPFTGYTYADPTDGRARTVNRANAGLLDEEAYCFYKPLAQRRLTIRDLLAYMLSLVRADDLAMLLGVSLLVTLVGLFSPMVNQLLFGTVIPSGNTGYLLPTLVLLVSVTVGTQLREASKSRVTQRLRTRVEIAIEPAAMSRMLMLPATFFRKYNAGELGSRLSAMTQLCDSLIDTFSGTLISALFSLIYLFQINAIAGALVWPAILIVLVQIAFNLAITQLTLKYRRREMAVGAKLNGLVFALFSGISKIKLTGSEKRGFAKWADMYRESAKLRYSPPKLLKYSGVINGLITSAGLLAFYYLSVTNGVSVSDYMAFTVSYGMISAALLSLVDLSTTYASIKPQLEMVEPLLQTAPESDVRKTVVENLSGGVELSHVCFRYADDGPDVLSDISLKIKPREYVALVGETGCGKSTLMRLLLGFEKPYKGAVYFDGMDVDRLDLRSLRRKIGVVTQDGKLFAGDIYSNIAIAAPGLSIDDAWEAARMAGVDKDIEEMPMGMHTLISEGSGGLSGGQRQRLMIARALAGKPRMILLDEATSALDNLTQKIVTESLDSLKCTRLVIAHRLSTIRSCDRILVLAHGEIVESGTFDELVERKGPFYELAYRQMLEEGATVAKSQAY